MNLTRVAVLCGGQSAEHEVSVRSAKTVVAVLDATRFEVQVIYISQTGQWFWWEKAAFLAAELDELRASSFEKQLMLLLGDAEYSWVLRHNQVSYATDVIFPLIHGTHGEDGDLQGLLEMANKPYVGPGVLSSAMCMDKAITKELTYDAGILTCRWQVVRKSDDRDQIMARIEQELGFPCFVKPARLGSSVGITKVKSRETLNQALDFAFRYDDKLIVEQNITGREIECSVLGNEKPISAWPGELIVHHEFYSYEAKYLDENGATIVTHAELSDSLATEIKRLALEVYKTLECSGMARVDFFVTSDEKVYFNELNTIPGFTSISMYPKAWEASGLPLVELLTQLVGLALERYQQKRSLSHQFQDS